MAVEHQDCTLKHLSHSQVGMTGQGSTYTEVSKLCYCNFLLDLSKSINAIAISTLHLWTYLHALAQGVLELALCLLNAATLACTLAVLLPYRTALLRTPGSNRKQWMLLETTVNAHNKSCCNLCNSGEKETDLDLFNFQYLRDMRLPDGKHKEDSKIRW